MATYKVIQDIEAEDHILGPLSLRQFIFALISIFLLYICFILYTKGAAVIIIFFLPPALFFGFFAFPFGRDQPTEVWALAKLRFWLKPRKRIWNQSGIKELVTITVPKKIERHLTDGLTQYEVESRLKVLANTLDTRGWAVKNSVPQLSFAGANIDSDRLVQIDPVSQLNDDISANTSDVLDDNTSPLAQHFSDMIDESTRSRHQELINKMNSVNEPEPSNNQWFMPNPTGNQTVPSGPLVDGKNSKEETAEDVELISKAMAQQEVQRQASSNLRTLSPTSTNNPQLVNDSSVPPMPIMSSTQNNNPPLTVMPDPAILSLASSDDLSVEAIAHEAKRSKGDDLDNNEVVISLH